MPQPIVPIHKQESMPILFGESLQPEFKLSPLQEIILSPTAADTKQKKYSVNTVKALSDIDKNTDLIVTAVTESNERFCSVPSTIDDNTLLTLKADGLVSGYGRSVKITDRGRTALRDYYLSTKNAFKESRTSDKVDFSLFNRKTGGE